MEKTMSMAVRLVKGVVQHYDWGGSSFIPNLLGLPLKGGETYAEYWLGTHPKGTATVWSGEKRQSLMELIQAEPEKWLGREVSQNFDRSLPFLFKILDVEKMLSIQVHPTREQAIAGFRRENELGIPPDAPHRNYRDPNRKPEIMVALTPFWLLHGFRTTQDAASLLRKHEELRPLAQELTQQGMESFYRKVMSASQAEIDTWLAPMAEKWIPDFESGALKDRNDPDYWAAKALLERKPRSGRFDRGIISIYLLNLVGLRKGQAIYQGPGILHAYLYGVNVELMSNSDNVFRGGLTSKHIDIPELLKTLNFEPVNPTVLEGEEIASNQYEYPVPVSDFSLRRLTLPNSEKAEITAEGPQVLLVLEGRVLVDGRMDLPPGSAIFIGDQTRYSLQAEADCDLFLAGTQV
jgi:mannose-6-phosphate isomerase